MGELLGEIYGGWAFSTPCSHFGGRTPRQGSAQAAEGGNHRRWVSSSERYTAGGRSTRLAVTSVIALYVGGPRKRLKGATIADG